MNIQRGATIAALSTNHLDLANWGSGFPASIYQSAMERVRDFDRKQAADFEERRRCRAEAAHRYRHELVACLGGEDRYRAFRRLLRVKRAQYRASMIRNGKSREALARALVDEINTIVRYNGIEPERIKTMADQIVFAIRPTNVPRDDDSGVRTPPSHLGEPIPLPDNPTSYSQFASCSNSHNLSWPRDGYGGFKDLSDCAANILGSSISMGTGDAGDADTFDAQVDCWLELFTMGPPGPLRVDVEAYGIDGINHLHTHDEVGWSDSITSKSTALFVHVIALTNASGVNEFMCRDTWWDWSYQTGKDHDINDDIGFAGKRLPTATAQSGMTPYQLGQNEVAPYITHGALNSSPVLVRIGMRRQDTISTNDVSIQSDTESRIHVASVALSNSP